MPRGKKTAFKDRLKGKPEGRKMPTTLEECNALLNANATRVGHLTYLIAAHQAEINNLNAGTHELNAIFGKLQAEEAAKQETEAPSQAQ